tara:strand:+ start:288 stop:542 length:255 start_codon:yes stop_codon:yes gene_type:complete
MANKVLLTDAQRDALIEQFVEIQVDSMDMGTMLQIISDNFTDYYEKCNDIELKEEVDNYDEDLFDELVDNVTQQYPKQLNSFGG